MVSIIVPVYNAADYIEKTIEMVSAQTYKDWELILVDDASSDGSADIIEDIIKKQGKRIRLIRKAHNEGAAQARNSGIDASAGRYIAFWMQMMYGCRKSLRNRLSSWKKMMQLFLFMPMNLVMKMPILQARL